MKLESNKVMPAVRIAVTPGINFALWVVTFYLFICLSGRWGRGGRGWVCQMFHVVDDLCS